MMLQGNESSIQVIQVHYVHSLGYFHELTLQFVQVDTVRGLASHVSNECCSILYLS
ncbi:uncharacterized protein [Physcomitrium patens]|uniref:uncharacterized protein n=1 Tax=Physcomitrium patens TaxID=3218 RepID=UPI003CCDEE9C